MCAQFIFVLLPARSETATAANPVIRCRCGMPVSLSFCRRSFPCWKVPGETAFRRHLLEFAISWSASEVAPGGPAPVSCGEGAGQIAVSPSPSRIRYQLVRVRGGSRWPGIGFLRRRCRQMWLYAGTFSNSLSAGVRQRWLSVALHRFPAEKVTVKSLFRRHLLEFVISWSATEVALGGPASVSYGEGDGKCGFSPSPSRLWVC